MLSSFILPGIVSALALGAVYSFFGMAAFITAGLLVILEVTLSFDNAVVNAQVLKKMSPAWQRAFLTWGILIAVFLTRFILPVLIVAATAWLSPWEIGRIAFTDPGHYAELVHDARYAIYAFGGVFLLMVSLKYFLDEGKQVHWIHAIEKHLASWGRIEAVEIAIALITAVSISFFVPPHETAQVLIAGTVGVVLFIVMQGLIASMEVEAGHAVAAGGLAFFLYLNVLDSAFSVDSVVGAFALTDSIPVIAVGLGIGAYFVRSLTVYMVRQKTLDTLAYIEHGAHWAIFGLAASMFASLLTEVPEIVTGTIGLGFVVAAYYSSIRMRAAARA